jgi:hypothetical protein
MARRLQKQTWVELRRLFVSGWSLGKLTKRFALVIGMGIATAQTTAQTPPDPGAPDRTRQRGDAKSGAIRASQTYWVTNAGSSSSDPHPPAAAKENEP